MKNIILIMLLTTSLMASSCKEENMAAADVNALFDFSIVNEKGNDLISEGLISEDKITVYHKGTDGKYQNYYESHLAYPKGIKISESQKNTSGENVLLFYPSLDRINNISSHIIDWGVEGFKKDTFDCVFQDNSENPANLFLIEVKLNGEPFWKSNSEQNSTLVKSLE